MAKCGCGTGIEQDCPRCNPVRRSELDQLRTELAKSQEEVVRLEIAINDAGTNLGRMTVKFASQFDRAETVEAKLSAVMPVVEAAENVSACYTEMNKAIDVDVHVNVAELIMEVATLKAYKDKDKDKEAGR